MRFVDTNIFIYVLTAHPTFGHTAKRILERLECGEEAVTSTLVMCEIAWVLEAMGKQGSIGSALEKILSYKSLKTVEVTSDDLLMGANNMAAYCMDFNDGVNLAVMMRFGLSEIYSNDKKHLGKIDTIEAIFE